MNKLPTLFISHGSPMQAIEPGEAGKVWGQLGQLAPAPKALLVVTAHWETRLPTLSGHAQPSMIYDFGGFPAPLYEIRYAAPGSPPWAARAQSLLKEADFAAEIDSHRGFDHGTWVPLLHMFPGADVPVVQLSVQTALGAHHHYRIGQALAPLREEGVLVIGSGHLTHNLRDWMMFSQGRMSDVRYAQEFQAWVYEHLMAHDIDSLLRYREMAPHAGRAHPTEEHFLPFFVALGAAGTQPLVERVFDGFEGGVLAMDSYRFN